MYIQSAGGQGQDVPTAVRGSDDASRVAVAGPTVQTGRGVAVESAQVATKPLAAQQVSSEQLKKAVDDINRAMQQSNRSLQFSMDAGTVVVKMTDSETGEVIRQLPSEETLAIARSIGDFQQGLLLKQKA